MAVASYVFIVVAIEVACGFNHYGMPLAHSCVGIFVVFDSP